jgi:polysaccharide biosynthesis protein PslG
MSANGLSRLALAALACLLAAGCMAPATPPAAGATQTGEPAATPAHTERLYPLPRLDGPQRGIQAFLWWHVDNKDGWRDADLVRDLGFEWLKHEFPWRDMSVGPGHYDWTRTDAIVELAAERGLKLLARLDHAPEWAFAAAPPGLAVQAEHYAEYCGAVAGRYAGRVAAYEAWNEPNLAREWNGQEPNPAGYVELLRACYLAIKAADPAAIVISAGMAPTDMPDPAVAIPDEVYYRAMYEAGAAPYFDMLGVHAPGYMNPPERSSDDTLADPQLESRVWTFRHAEDVRALMVEYGDGDKQIAITEMGWTSDPVNPEYAWYAVSEAKKADYLVRAFRFARQNWQPWIGLMSIVYIADPHWTEADEQYWWAITRPTAPGDPAHLLPAYEALRDMEW